MFGEFAMTLSKQCTYQLYVLRILYAANGMQTLLGSFCLALMRNRLKGWSTMTNPHFCTFLYRVALAITRSLQLNFHLFSCSNGLGVTDK